MIEFNLPSLGADMEEGRLLEWRVKAGDRIHKGDIVAVIDTEKAAIDLESWQDGVVYELLTNVDETISVGTPMAYLLEPDETKEQAEQWKKDHPLRKPETVKAPEREIASVPVAETTEKPAQRRRVSPAARQRAQALGVNIETISGTGPDQAITIADVERASGQKLEPAARAPRERDRVGEMRKVIGAAMTRSKREIPHYYLAEDVPLKRASEWLTKANAERDLSHRLLMAPLILKAIALALREFPELNGFWRNGAFEPGTGIHVGTAISLRQGGLIAPAIHDVDKKDLDTLMRDLSDLVARARSGSLKSSELSDATITLTNLGEQGTATVFGVIYPPQVALVGVGRIVETPFVQDGSIELMPITTVTLSADHRATDGHLGALFIRSVSALLQTPEALSA